MHCKKFYLYRSLAMIGVFVFCLVQLGGCSIVRNKGEFIDGAPDIDIDTSKISDAVPKVEPYHPYGTRDYVIGGRHYHVLKSSKGYIKRGYASWYGSKFHGNYTSMQERYNLYEMTAASKELPLPSYVQVTNLRNGRKVIVRVNDRGPFHSKRMIDLSYAAAKKLGFVDTGVAPVKVVAIDPRTWGKSVASTKKTKYAIKSKSKKVYLQVGAFSHIENAKQYSTKIAQLTNKPTHIDHSLKMYRVKVGPLACTNQGDKLKQLLENNGFDKIIITAN
jgi:rare lipoprotein A